MKIDFEKDVNGFQNARKLKMLLEHYVHADITDRSTELFIESLIRELDEFLSSPEFKKFDYSRDIDKTFLDAARTKNSFIRKFISIWQVLTGPSKHEMILSKQRYELIERAERAEAIAFDAIAETAEIGRQRDEALEKLKKIESEGNTD